MQSFRVCYEFPCQFLPLALGSHHSLASLPNNHVGLGVLAFPNQHICRGPGWEGVTYEISQFQRICFFTIYCLLTLLLGKNVWLWSGTSTEETKMKVIKDRKLRLLHSCWWEQKHETFSFVGQITKVMALFCYLFCISRFLCENKLDFM